MLGLVLESTQLVQGYSYFDRPLGGCFTEGSHLNQGHL